MTTILPTPFAWCDIPAGQVTLKDSTNHDGTAGGVYSVEHFFIAKYPITNAQYQVFVEAPDGYANALWWDYGSHAQLWRAGHAAPSETAYPGDDLPRTNVTWYEALAFCRWLSHHSGDSITLPTEQQWQRAAQGDDGREYPWGDEFDAERCNCWQSQFVGPTPVNRCLKGASPFGVLDMCGNVLEWCLTAWGQDMVDVSRHLMRCQRGGSWDYFGHYGRVIYRGGNYPDLSNQHTGFRIVSLV